MSTRARTSSLGVSRSRRKSEQRQTSLLVIGLGLVTLLAVVLVFAVRGGGEMGTAPDFSATTLYGDTVQLSSFRGQVVMLNFWATWCPPCRAEMPSIERAYEQYQDDGLMVLAINNGEQPAQIAPFASALSLTLPVVLDTDAQIQRTFGITGYPTSLFIGRNGEVYATHVGMVTPAQLEEYIQTGLAQPSA